MDLILSFDSEDYITPQAADAELWWAQTLTERGIRASFQCVGHLIDTLIRNGRSDVIQAISQHEIGHHSRYHSQQPSIPELLENLSLADGIASVLRWEAPAFQTLIETFGRMPVSYCPPGDSWTPATLLAMASCGVKVFCNDSVPIRSDRAVAPCWYCGLLTTAYNMAFESFFSCEQRQSCDFQTQFAQRRSFGDDDVLVIFSHPTRLVTSEFWDKPLAGGHRVAMENWPAAPLHSPAQIQDNKDRCRRWLDWIIKQPDVRIIDFATLYAERSHNRRTLGHLLDECGLAPGQEGLIPLRAPKPGDLLHADQRPPVEYKWELYPADFRGHRLIEQARNLSWTASPARRSPQPVRKNIVPDHQIVTQQSTLRRRALIRET